MPLEVVHPLDRGKLRDIAEALCDISLARKRLEAQVSGLAICLGDPSAPWRREAPDWAAGVVDRLLAVADHRLGREGMAECVLAELWA